MSYEKSRKVLLDTLNNEDNKFDVSSVDDSETYFYLDYLQWVQSMCFLMSSMNFMVKAFGEDYKILKKTTEKMDDFDLIKLSFIDKLEVSDIAQKYGRKEFKDFYLPNKEEASQMLTKRNRMLDLN